MRLYLVLTPSWISRCHSRIVPEAFLKLPTRKSQLKREYSLPTTPNSIKMPYQSPTDEKIASYYTSPHSPLNNSSNSQHLHVDEVERGLFSPSECGTPPPSYNAPSYLPPDSENESESEWCCGTNDGSLSESCGLRSGKSKTIAFILGMSFFAWMGMGGTSFYNPGAKPWGPSWHIGGPSYIAPDVPVPVRPEEDVRKEEMVELRNGCKSTMLNLGTEGLGEANK